MACADQDGGYMDCDLVLHDVAGMDDRAGGCSDLDERDAPPSVCHGRAISIL